jgi:hypothetical protein
VGELIFLSRLMNTFCEINVHHERAALTPDFTEKEFRFEMFWQ